MNRSRGAEEDRRADFPGQIYSSYSFCSATSATLTILQILRAMPARDLKEYDQANPGSSAIYRGCVCGVR